MIKKLGNVLSVILVIVGIILAIIFRRKIIEISDKMSVGLLIAGSIFFILAIIAYLYLFFSRLKSKETKKEEDESKPDDKPPPKKTERSWLRIIIGCIVLVVGIVVLIFLIGLMRGCGGSSPKAISSPQTSRWVAGWSKPHGVVGVSSQRFGGPFDVEMIRKDDQEIVFYIINHGKREQKVSLKPSSDGDYGWVGEYLDFRYGAKATCKFNFVDESLVGEVSAEDGTGGWTNYSIRKL